MPLLDRTGAVIPDRWTRVDDDAPLPPGPAIVSVARLSRGSWPAEGVGVALTDGAALAPIVPWLDRLALVAVPFPGFRDGRGFSAARALRERYQFTGEVRAFGQLLPDQYVALLRVGVSTVELPAGCNPSSWHHALQLNGPLASAAPLPLVRRRALPFSGPLEPPT